MSAGRAFAWKNKTVSMLCGDGDGASGQMASGWGRTASAAVAVRCAGAATVALHLDGLEVVGWVVGWDGLQKSLLGQVCCDGIGVVAGGQERRGLGRGRDEVLIYLVGEGVSPDRQARSLCGFPSSRGWLCEVCALLPAID